MTVITPQRQLPLRSRTRGGSDTLSLLEWFLFRAGTVRFTWQNSFPPWFSTRLTFEASSSFTRSSAVVSLAFRAAISCSMGITTERSFSASSWALDKVSHSLIKDAPLCQQTFRSKKHHTSCSSASVTTGHSLPFSSHPPGSPPLGPR